MSGCRYWSIKLPAVYNVLRRCSTAFRRSGHATDELICIALVVPSCTSRFQRSRTGQSNRINIKLRAAGADADGRYVHNTRHRDVVAAGTGRGGRGTGGRELRVMDEATRNNATLSR